VALVGYCQEGKEQILIYEYMPGGTVRESLYGKTSWKTLKWWFNANHPCSNIIDSIID
jgi:hypothetical protein